MRAVVFETFGGTPSVQTVSDPVPERHGVVVQVGATGVCRSDWHGWMGHDSDVVLPHVPGHELAGTVVVAVGSEVTRWREGDRVTVPFVAGCGTCPECHAGHQQVCEAQMQPGFTHWGSFAEYVGLHQADLNLVRLPEGMRFATAASLGCRFATAFRAVVDQGRVGAGRMGRCAWLRRRRPVGDHDRQGAGRAGRGGGYQRRKADAGPPDGGRGHRRWPRCGRARSDPRPDGGRRACGAGRGLAQGRPAGTPSPACAGAGGMCRWA